MLKRSLIILAGGLAAAGCESNDDGRMLGFDTTADPTFMDRATTMESPPTADFDSDWHTHRGYAHSSGTSIQGGDSADRSDWNESDRTIVTRNDRNYNDPNRPYNADRNMASRNDPNYDARTNTTYDQNRPERTDDPNRTVATANSAEVRILTLLHEKNYEEIEAGRLAQERGTSPSVREYGQHMIDEHADACRKVEDVARELNIALPAKPVADAKRNDMEKKDSLAKLRTLQGAEFDREFARMMEQGHEDLIQKVEDAREDVRDSRVRALLDEILPVLREHHERVQTIAAR
jgi:putative membrane protein